MSMVDGYWRVGCRLHSGEAYPQWTADRLSSITASATRRARRRTSQADVLEVVEVGVAPRSTDRTLRGRRM